MPWNNPTHLFLYFASELLIVMSRSDYDPYWWLTFGMVALGAAIVGGVVVGMIMKKYAVVPTGHLPSPQALVALPVASEPIMTNSEDIVWTDWRGRERKLTIHREVH